MKYKFKSNYQYINSVTGVESQHVIQDEPMIYGGSWKWCRQNAGPLTNNIMDKIIKDVEKEIYRHSLMGYHPVIDTKSVMLMQDFYPCIPGWHCDGVVRKDRSSQPDLSTLNNDIKHYICHIDTEHDLCNTAFMNTDLYLDVDENKVWQSVSKRIDKISDDSFIDILQAGHILKFSRSTLHKCMPATTRGWRYFFRLSFYHMPAMNQIRKQVQVYTDIHSGW